MRKNKNTSLFPLLLGLALAAVLILALTLPGKDAGTADDPKILAGIEYLEALEKKDPNTVRQIRKDILQAKLDAQRDALVAQLRDGTTDPFSMFTDYALMGDSRAVGFWYWGCLDKSRVLADGGHTIRDIATYMDTLVSMNPSTLYLCYGLNDVSIGYWDTKEEYVEEYMQILQQLQQQLPDTTIVVSSILPARDPAFAKRSKWRQIPQWSAAVEEACRENGILFANCDHLETEFSNLWDPDGIHFREAFYPHWATELAVTALMEVTNDETENGLS